MKVLLISPEYPDTFWSFRHALPFIRRAASFPPLGLLTVAAMLPSGWQKRLVDLNVEALTDEHLAWADLAFVGAMIAQHVSARAVIARCKAAGVRIVAGGPLFSGDPHDFPDVDHLLLGEGELTLPEFLHDLDNGCARRLYVARGFADVATTPVPLWELAKLRDYASVSVQFSRGCPYDCEFCSVTALFGHRPRTKSVTQVVAELDRLYALGWRGSIFFVDDNLIGNKRVLREALLPALIDWRHGKRIGSFFTQASMNLADDAGLMGLMTRAGFDSVFVGIETPDDLALAECNKKQNVGRDLVADIKRIQRAGIEVRGGFIVGFDSDTPGIFSRQFEFIQRSGIVTAMVGMLQALPGTRLYHRLSSEGRLIGSTTGDNLDGTTNIVPTMSADVLRERYRALVRDLYAPRAYYRRLRTFLREFETPVRAHRISLQRVLAFARSTMRLGVLGRERFQYWRLLIWTLLRRPRHFARAVELAIYGYHYRRVSELHIQ